MRAFSLVELSIVLVILGLLTGGILAGQSLIRAAELRSVASDYQRFSAATLAFRDRYMAIPGDMRDATRFWLRQTSDSWCASNSGATTSTNGVCDGDGNNAIYVSSSTPSEQAKETFQFWRQLALAQLIEGQYSGLAGSISGAACTGENVPMARIATAMWAVRDDTINSSNTDQFALGIIGTHFTLGTQDGNGWAQRQFLRNEEVWNIDTKLDDGKPARGKVLSPDWSGCTTATERNDLDANYLLTDTTVSCKLWMKW